MHDDDRRRPLVRATYVAALACGYMLLILSLLVGVEVVGRKLFAFSIQGVDEIGAYALAVLGAVGYSWTLVCRGHTRIDLLLGRLPAPVQALLNVVALAALAGFALFMAWQAWLAYSETLEYRSIANSPLRTPLWIPQTPWLAGQVLFALVSVLLAAHAFYLLFVDRRRLNRSYGPPTLEEEVREGVAAAVDGDETTPAAGGRP